MMNENKSGKRIVSKPAFKMFAAGFVLFACALAFTPSAEVIRTIPLFVAGGAAAHALSVSAGMISSLSAVFTLCMYLASGRGVAEAVFYAVVSCLLATAGVYVIRFVRASKKTQKNDVKKKCITAAVTSVAVSLVLSMVLCGNAVSFLIKDSTNTEYIKKNYGETVEKRYTSYEALAAEYRTYVSFKDDGGVYGKADECYVKSGSDAVWDDVRNYYEQKILYTANARLASAVSKATWGYNITASDIAFENGEVLSSDAVADDYMDRVSYVVSFESIFTKNEKDKFVSICEDTVEAISESGIAFERIVLCGGNATEVLFSLEVTPETSKKDVRDSVSDFDAKQVASLGVTEMTILDYWMNK